MLFSKYLHLYFLSWKGEKYYFPRVFIFKVICEFQNRLIPVMFWGHGVTIFTLMAPFSWFCFFVRTFLFEVISLLFLLFFENACHLPLCNWNFTLLWAFPDSKVSKGHFSHDISFIETLCNYFIVLLKFHFLMSLSPLCLRLLENIQMVFQ